MKLKGNIFLSLLIIGSIILGFTFSYVFTRPAFFPVFDFSDKGQIGDTIGGITTPLFTLIGFILVFYSFKEQYKANQIQIETLDSQMKNQELSEEYKLLEYLLERTDNKIDLFEYMEKRDAVESLVDSSPWNEKREKVYILFHGTTAIMRFCKSLINKEPKLYANEYFNLKSIDFFSDFYYILKHAAYLKSSILNSNLDEYRKKMLNDRFLLLYNSKLSLAIELLIQKFDSIEISNDLIVEIKMLKVILEGKNIGANT